MNYWNRKRLCRKTRTKELKPKDGYNRFKFMGKVFRYLEEDIHIVSWDFSGMELLLYGSIATDENGMPYDVEFIKRNGKYCVFSVSERYRPF